MGKTYLEKILTETTDEDQPLFVPYIMAGDGGLTKLKKDIIFLEDCGVSAIEIGIPFSDPMADGPVIQQAGERSLASGTTIDGIFDLLHSFRDRSEERRVGKVCRVGW